MDTAKEAPSVARVQYPAPPFSGQAVVDGSFQALSHTSPLSSPPFSSSICFLPVQATDLTAFLPPADLSLSTFTLNNQWLLLGFIPMAWTFVCPTEIIAFADALPHFRARNCAVVFASTDSEYSLLAWNNASRKDGGLGNVQLPLLSDKNHQLSRRYGVLVEEEGIALRGLFLIDPRGIVRQITINDLPVGRSVDEALRLLDAFKFTDEYGEVCPANWNPGQEAIKETTKGREEYLEHIYGDGAKAGTIVPKSKPLTNGHEA
ncbi:MAG: cTPxI [Bathelium mastoideum]|nr:MAG: cTPxI [Bathelium mastoideum]